MRVNWLTLFFDYGVTEFDRGIEFWTAVTGSSLSSTRGPEGEFVSLVPPNGGVFIKFQRTRNSSDVKHHFCIGVDDVARASFELTAAGADLIAAPSHHILCSPGGLVFCLVPTPGDGPVQDSWHTTALPAPITWPTGQRSRLDQVTVNVSQANWATEIAFWEVALEAKQEALVARTEFCWLRTKRQLALDVLAQKLKENQPATTVRANLGSTNRTAEVARHMKLGAVIEAEDQFRVVMRDPSGLRYCITEC
jgi:catechol 2,3-dioxygenase-like lactoylglutathione lyase family enzyme